MKNSIVISMLIIRTAIQDVLDLEITFTNKYGTSNISKIDRRL